MVLVTFQVFPVIPKYCLKEETGRNRVSFSFLEWDLGWNTKCNCLLETQFITIKGAKMCLACVPWG
jgi:hypothetical protein